MRTTVNIEDSLLVRAKDAAARSRRSLGDVVNDALRLLLAERAPEARGRVRLPTFGGSGLQPGVDLEDKDALAALLDKGEADARAAG
ncbi:MAG: hypothetical protein ACRDSL_03420 [Pseudonocardiaceae bacterium]